MSPNNEPSIPKVSAIPRKTLEIICPTEILMVSLTARVKILAKKRINSMGKSRGKSKIGTPEGKKSLIVSKPFRTIEIIKVQKITMLDRHALTAKWLV